MKNQSTKIETPMAPLKRYRVVNSVRRRLFASFDTEEEARSYIMDQPAPSSRFAIDDGPAPALAGESG
jgi:hypothetical protein